MPNPGVMVNVEGSLAEIRVTGRATFALGRDMREFVARAARSGVRRLQVDVAECPYMDSTFIGVLTMAAVRQDPQPLTVDIVNAAPRVIEQICDLGIGSLFTFVHPVAAAGAAAPMEPLEHARDGDAGLSRVMLEAHEALATASPANAAKFHDVVEFLRGESTAASAT